MFENYGYVMSQIFSSAEQERRELKHPYVGSEHLLLALLKKEGEIASIFKKYGVTYKSFLMDLKKIVGVARVDYDFNLYTPLLKRVIERAQEESERTNASVVTEQMLCLSLLEEGEGIAIRILVGSNVDIEGIYASIKKSLNVLGNEDLELFKVGILLNEKVSLDTNVVGREKELNHLMETILRKNKNNPVLVGKAGVGKTAIVEELARRIVKKEVPFPFQEKKIVELTMASLVAGTKYRGEFEERLNKILEECLGRDDIILFIDEIHTMVHAGGAEGAIEASEILKPYLARGDIKVIGATTLNEYNKTILKDKALDRRFEKILVDETNAEETLHILKSCKESYQNHHHVEIPDEVLETIVEVSNRSIFNRNNPDKSIEILDSACALVRRREIPTSFKSIDTICKKKEESILKQDYQKASFYHGLELEMKNQFRKNKVALSIKDVYDVIRDRTGIPIGEDLQPIIHQIEKEVNENIIGQTRAKEEILKHVSLKLKEDVSPLSLLLTGPTGVGKTEIVKLLSKNISKSFLRLDMSEYHLDSSVQRLIGAPAGYVGYEEEGILSKVRDYPYTVILLDEIEKAHPKVLNLFLQILDEGFVTDHHGEKIDFRHCFFFFTSNALGKSSCGFLEKEKSFQDFFSLEFLGRIDGLVSFDPITREDVISYLEKSGIIEKDAQEKILLEANYQKEGLRGVRQVVRHYKYQSELEKVKL